MTNDDDDNYCEFLKKRLLFNSTHRGCKEMDIILGGFANKFLPMLSYKDLIIFSRILEFDDILLYKYFTGSVMLDFGDDDKEIVKFLKKIYLHCNESILSGIQNL